MNSTKSEATYTEEGQALAYSNITCQQLIELFSTCFGPNGSYKALVTNELELTRNGHMLCKGIKFSHPTSIIITRAGRAIYERVGDGVKTFILLTSFIFTEAFEQYMDGSKIPHIVKDLNDCVEAINVYLKNNLLPLDDANLQLLINSQVNNTNITEIIMKVIKHTNDLSLVEIMRIETDENKFIPGLVLDHGIRHSLMPSLVENCAILVTNMSLEYEQPEVNAEFVYSSIEKRENFARVEKATIEEKALKFVELAKSLGDKKLVIFNEKGIDLTALEILAKKGILALRRCKRRNLERLVNMCGGKIITQQEQINKDNLGFCKQVKVKKIADEQFTFVEGVPLKGACTILIKDNIEFDRTRETFKGALRAVMLAIKERCCIRGGKHLFVELHKYFKSQNKNTGQLVLTKAFEKICKILIKNEGKPAHEEFVKITNEGSDMVIDNVSVLGNVLTNGIFTAVSILLCDEIITNK